MSHESYQAVAVFSDTVSGLVAGQEYTLLKAAEPGIVSIPGKDKLFSAYCFQRVGPAPATTPAPAPPEAAVAPAGGLPGAVKYDSGKPRMDLLPPEALREVADVLGMGAQKYDAHNWRRGLAYSRLIAAALRHLFSWIGGENTDPESGKSHLAHAACCLLFLITFEVTKTGTDDRYASN